MLIPENVRSTVLPYLASARVQSRQQLHQDELNLLQLTPEVLSSRLRGVVVVGVTFVTFVRESDAGAERESEHRNAHLWRRERDAVPPKSSRVVPLSLSAG